MVSLPLTLIDVTSMQFQKIPLLIESKVSYDDIRWYVAAGSTHVSHSVDALDGYVFIVHDSVGFSQICGGSGGIDLRKRTDITIYPVVIMPCTHCLKYVQLCC